MSPIRAYLLSVVLNAASRGGYLVIMGWILVTATGSASSVGWLLIWFSVSDIALAPIIGIFADRHNKKNLWLVSDILRSVTLFSLMGYIYFFGSSSYLIYASGIIYAILDRVTTLVTQTIITSIVEPGELKATSAKLMATTQIGNVSGAAFAGVLLTFVEPAYSVGFIAASYLCSALIFTIRVRYDEAKVKRIPSTIWIELGAAMKLFADDKHLIKNALSQSVLSSSGALINALLPGFVQFVLLGQAWQYGVIDGAWGLSALAVAMTLAFYQSDKVGNILIKWGGVLLAVSFFALASSQHFLLAAVAVGALGAIYSGWRINSNAEMLFISGPEDSGKVRGFSQLVTAFTGLIVYLTVILVPKGFPISGLFYLYGGYTLLIGFIVFSIGEMRRRI